MAPPSSYDNDDSSDDESIALPIRVAPKVVSRKRAAGAKRRTKQYISPLFDDRGHPHPQDDWESMLPDVKEGRLIRKRKHKPPKICDVDPDS